MKPPQTCSSWKSKTKQITTDLKFFSPLIALVQADHFTAMDALKPTDQPYSVRFYVAVLGKRGENFQLRLQWKTSHRFVPITQ